MKKQVSLICVVLLLVSFVSLSAQSPYRARWCPWNNYSSSLKFAPEQMRKFENLYQDFIKETHPIQNDLTSKSMALRMLFFKSSPDNIAVITKQKEISVLQQKLQEKIFDYRLEALGILTTEQILLLPSDCSLGFNLGRGYGRGFGMRNGMGYGRGFGRGSGRDRGMGFYNGRGRGRGMRRNAGRPFWWR